MAPPAPTQPPRVDPGRGDEQHHPGKNDQHRERHAQPTSVADPEHNEIAGQQHPNREPVPWRGPTTPAQRRQKRARRRDGHDDLRRVSRVACCREQRCDRCPSRGRRIYAHGVAKLALALGGAEDPLIDEFASPTQA
jgi:hypothetical protein